MTRILIAAAILSTQLRTFEVASVKPFTPSPGNPYGFGCQGVDGTIPPNARPGRVAQGRCSGAANLRLLMSNAYQIEPQNISGGPAWATSFNEGIHIEAKAEDTATTTAAQLREMLQALLADQLKLKFHRETKEVQGYALVVARGGPKLKEVPSDAKQTNGGAVNVAAQTMTLRGIGPVSLLVNQLKGALNGPLVDKTGLTGIYEYSFSVPMASRTADSTGPSIFTTVQEELGLRLESVPRVPLEVIIIDSVEKPKG